MNASNPRRPERRIDARLRVNAGCTWARDARLADVSEGGCYVASTAVPKVDEHVEFKVTLTGVPVQLRGVVVHATRGEGSPIRFEDLSERDRAYLHAFLAIVQNTPREK